MPAVILVDRAMQGGCEIIYDGVRTVFKPISSVYLKDDPTTWEEIKARGHAAIVGVGH